MSTDWSQLIPGCLRPILVFSAVLWLSTGGSVRAEENPIPHPVETSEVVPEEEGGYFGVVLESIFGKANQHWIPLYLSDFASGFFEPWIPPPNGESGSPRQGWLNSFDGHFTREYHFGYFNTVGRAGDRDTDLGLYQFQTPLSRRLFLGIDVPFIVALNGGNAPSQTGFGDVVIAPRVMLQETQNLSVSAGLAVRLPTGDQAIGGDRTSLFPNVQFWSDIGNHWTLRGGVGLNVLTDQTVGDPNSTLLSNLAIGRTFTEHDQTPFGDFATYASFNMVNDFRDGSTKTVVTVTPGIRTHLWNNLFFLAAVELPMTGPRPFDHRLQFLFVKGF
jgi:hypothetical protein